MRLNVLLSISAVYLALVGLGYLLAPSALLFGVLDPGAPAALTAQLRGVSSTFIGIAVLNWLARSAEASTARNAIVLANTVGFGLAGALGLVALASGAPTLVIAPAAINLAIAVAFFWLGRASMSAKKA